MRIFPKLYFDFFNLLEIFKKLKNRTGSLMGLTLISSGKEPSSTQQRILVGLDWD